MKAKLGEWLVGQGRCWFRADGEWTESIRARNAVQAIQKRLQHRSANVQLFSLTVSLLRTRLPSALSGVGPKPAAELTRHWVAPLAARRRARQQLRGTTPPRNQQQSIHSGTSQANQ